MNREVLNSSRHTHCVLEQDTFYSLEYWLIHKKRWSRPDMIETLLTGTLTGTLNLNTKKQKDLSFIFIYCLCKCKASNTKDHGVLNEYCFCRGFCMKTSSVSAQSQQPPYAFSAYDLSAAKPSDGSILVFTKVHFNDDELYSTTTGKYTAPVDGLYEFHATLSSCCSSKMSIDVEFQAGDKAIGKFSVVDLTSYDRSSSGSATARLQKDTEVYMRVTATGGNYRFREDAYFMSSFTGYRI